VTGRAPSAGGRDGSARDQALRRPALSLPARDARAKRSRVLVLALGLALVSAGSAVAAGAPPAAPAAARDQAMKEIVRAWSHRLNARDDEGGAALFELPAVVIQNDVFRFRKRSTLAEWHALLPCSGHILSIVVDGRFATAAFRLGDRRGSPCPSRGVVVAARFEIVRGKIVSWEQIPVPEAQQPYRGAPS
jgi:hypothetical protein